MPVLFCSITHIGSRVCWCEVLSSRGALSSLFYNLQNAVQFHRHPTSPIKSVIGVYVGLLHTSQGIELVEAGCSSVAAIDMMGWPLLRAKAVTNIGTIISRNLFFMRAMDVRLESLLPYLIALLYYTCIVPGTVLNECIFYQ